jgi:hypothetical protein
LQHRIAGIVNKQAVKAERRGGKADGECHQDRQIKLRPESHAPPQSLNAPAVEKTDFRSLYHGVVSHVAPALRRTYITEVPACHAVRAAANVGWCDKFRPLRCQIAGPPQETTLSQASSHVFVCFSSKDEATARDIVNFLERDGIKCWISLRDVPAGQNYQECIVQALETAQGIVFLFSEHSSRSGEIKKELSIGGSINVPVFPLRLSPIAPTGALRYELATRQWIDLFPDPEYALGKLARTIKHALTTPQGDNGSQDTHGLFAAGPLELGPAVPVGPAQIGPRAPIVVSGSAEFEAIRTLLARHIGPIAKVLIEKTANETRTAAEFCDRLADRVSRPADRAAFLQAVRAQLAVKS